MEVPHMVYGHTFGHILVIFFLKRYSPICFYLFLSLDMDIEIQGFPDSM